MHVGPLGGAPTLMVWSGGGWHAYWCYREVQDAQDLPSYTAHHRASAFLRGWLNHALKAECADDMSSRDRILRVPGSHNYKPSYGAPVEVELVHHDPRRLYEPDDLLAFAPEDFAPAARAKQAFDAEALPTEVPARIRAVAEAAGLILRARRDPERRIKALELGRCPACGDTRGSCWIAPTSGRLRTHHQQQCPAAAAHTGGQGLALVEWVARFAPAAIAAAEQAPKAEYKAGDARLPRLLDEIAGAATEEHEAALADRLHGLGLVPEVVEAIAHDSEVVWASSSTPGLTRGALALARAAGEGALILPVRDGSGTVRTLLLDGRRASPKIAGCSVGDLDVAVLGDLPRAIHEAEHQASIVLARDPDEWLVLRALISLGMLEAEVLYPVSPVLGLLQALTRAWGEAGKLPRRVVLLGDDEGLAGVASGRAGVAVVDVDVGGIVRACSKDPRHAVRLITGAPFRFPPPVDVQQAGPVIADDLRAAIRRCGVSAGRQPLVIYQVDPGAGKSRQALEAAADVAAGRIPLPWNGRRPRGVSQEAWPPPTRRVAFALSSLALAEEKFNDLGVLRPEAERAFLKGALEHCRFRTQVEQVYPSVGRRGICGAPGSESRCPEADHCPGAREPEAEAGAVTVCSHAMVRHLKVDLAVVDEAPGVVDLAAVTQHEVESLFAGGLTPRAATWRNELNPDAVDAARLFVDAANEASTAFRAQAGRGAVDPYPVWVSGDELHALLESREHLLRLLSVGYAPEAEEPPVPSPQQARAGLQAERWLPSRLAFRALRELAAWVERRRAPKDPLAGAARPPVPTLRLDPEGEWVLEVRRVLTLPDAPVLLLDATGDLALPEVEAAYPDRHVTLVARRVQGATPLDAIHLRSRSVRRKHLLDATGAPRPAAAARFRSALRVAARAIRQGGYSRERAAVGVLTYKPLAEVLGRDVSTGQGEGALALATLPQVLALDGIDIATGYYGRDDRGTNRYERVDALVVIGEPTPNLGAVAADCELLGLDPAPVVRARAEATLVQAIHRARHSRRRGDERAVLVYVGETPPAVPGLEWRTRELVGPVDQQDRALAAVVATAEHYGDVFSPSLVERLLAGPQSPFPAGTPCPPRRALEDACKAFAAREGIPLLTLARRVGRPVQAYAPSVEQARRALG